MQVFYTVFILLNIIIFIIDFLTNKKVIIMSNPYFDKNYDRKLENYDRT